MADQYGREWGGRVWVRNRRDRLMSIRAELLDIAGDLERTAYHAEWAKSYREWSREIEGMVRALGVADPGPVDRDPKF